MSVESLAIAINHSKATGSARLVLIGIANHDGDGGAWPTLDTLARYAAVHRRNVLMALDKLEALGEIRRHRQKGGTLTMADHRRPNLYEFLLRCPADCDHSKNHRTRRVSTVGEFSTGVMQASPLDLDGVTGASPGGVTEASPKPSLEPSTSEAVLEPATDRGRAHSHSWREWAGERYCAACGVSDDGRKHIDWATRRVEHLQASA